MTIEDVSTYQTLVGRLQGGAKFFMKELGFFQFFNTEYSGREMELLLIADLTITQHGSASFALGSVLAPAYGMHVFSAATGASLASFQMPAASVGAKIRLNGSYLVTDANISIATDSTIGLLLNTRGSDLSSFELSAAGQLSAFCVTDGTWQITEENINEHPSS